MTSFSSNKHGGSGSSSRYCNLLRLIEKTLANSKSTIDLETTIKECYGDDVSIFGDDDGSNAVLQNLLSSMLDRVNYSVLNEMKEQVLEENNVGPKLQKLELIVSNIERERTRKDEADEKAKQSARQALEQVETFIPKNMKPEDLFRMEQYRHLQGERDNVLQQITEIEQDIQQLERQTETHSSNLTTQLETMEDTRKKALQPAVDAFSMISS